MSLSVTTNISSLNAQNNLARTQSKLSTAIERLSSGMRINSAKDDAAGLAISTRFTTQINGLNQAVRNANDGISMAQTTESALDEVTNNLQRMRLLAVQSASGSNSSTDRAALDKEVQQRLAEVTRIAQQTNFNGTKVLDGSAGTVAFQVGANVGETISVNFGVGMKASQIGQIEAASVSASGKAPVFPLKLGEAQTVKVDAASVTLKKDASFKDAKELVAALNAGFKDAGVDAQASADANGKLSIATSRLDAVFDVSGATALGFAASDKATVGLDSKHLSDISIATTDGANDAIRRVDAALQAVSDLRSNLGAVQNRFHSTITNLQTISQNLDSSRSQIKDADFAAETANMSSANILQQAGVSVLAQANTSQQSVLKLLQ
ncbi:flagellin [Dyella sp. LX-66]|uniref:flagellin n=1 Tax=unclassified Dyella TaxID=2634549 RepID=UPI001BE09FF6|nr:MULTISPECIES: flagellin [unclassified Dyella]MBT2116000.1 flagellin [Dyella sp. LX-1]MBT2138010.1 flagellin [Dyella sp. LX-66]